MEIIQDIGAVAQLVRFLEEIGCAIVSAIGISLVYLLRTKANTKDLDNLSNSFDSLKEKIDKKLDDLKEDNAVIKVDNAAIRSSMHEVKNTLSRMCMDKDLTLNALIDALKEKRN